MPILWKQDLFKRIKVTLNLLLVFFVLVAATTPPVSETENPDLQSSPEYAPGRVIVKLKGGGLAAAQSQVAALDAIQQLQARHRLASAQPVFAGTFSEPDLAAEVGLERIFLLELPEGQEVQSAIAELTSDPSVEYAEPDYILTIATDDTYFKEQWALNNTGQEIYKLGSGLVDADIDMPEGWTITKGKSEIIIAIVDTGADLSHPDLAAKIVPGYDYVNKDNIPQDDNGHGTHVAGIAAAITNNGRGVAGVCQECKIMPIKSFDYSGSGYVSVVVEGIRYGADHGAHVLNLSFTIKDPSASENIVLHDAIRYAYLKNIPVVAAMGNDGNSTLQYPAAYPETIAIGATNYLDLRPYYSSFGDHIDLVAPGSYILSTYWDTLNEYDYVYNTGTSMATPHVSGVIGLMRSITTRLSVEETRKILRDSADDLGIVGWDRYYGAGRLNAYTTLQTTKKVISSLRLTGSKYVLPETESAYSVTVSLSTAQTPITYTWTATGQDPVTSTTTRLSNQVRFNWAEAGTKTVRVTASNGLTSRTVSTTVYVGWPIYMPSIRK